MSTDDVYHSITSLWLARNVRQLTTIVRVISLIAGLITIWQFLRVDAPKPEPVIIHSSLPAPPERRPFAFDTDAEKVRDVLSKYYSVEHSEITRTVSLVNDLGLDETDLFIFLLDLEPICGCEFPYNKIDKATTFGEIIGYMRAIARPT